MIQVDASHYEFGRYYDKRRWISLYHQIDTILGCSPKSILEIGGGSGMLRLIMRNLGFSFYNLDIDESLRPDYIGSVTDIPLKDNMFDITCAFQVLEHLPYNDAIAALAEMSRVSSRFVLISLPDAERRFPLAFYIPRYGLKYFSIMNLLKRGRRHKFDGQHYWELNVKGISEKKFLEDVSYIEGLVLRQVYRVPEHTYHRFFIFEIE